MRWTAVVVQDRCVRDALDRQIVALLLEDARRPLADVARRVNLSVPATTRRVDRLEREGVIAGYTVVLGAEAADWRVEAFVELLCRDRTAVADVLAAVEPHPEVIGAWTVTGDADALIHLRTPSTEHLEATLERIRTDEHVQRTRTQLVLTRLFERPVALPHGDCREE